MGDVLAWPPRCWECGRMANRTDPNGTAAVGCGQCFPDWWDMCWRDDCSRPMGHKGAHKVGDFRAANLAVFKAEAARSSEILRAAAHPEPAAGEEGS